MMGDSTSSEPPLPTQPEEVVNEVRELRQEFRTYQQESEKQEFRRRRENVQVLVAIAVIGGYASFVSSRQSVFSTQLGQILSQIMVGVSGIFLLVKLATITLRPDFDHRLIEKLDEWLLPFMFVMAIFGLVIVGGASLLLQTIGQVPQQVVVFVQAILFALVFVGALAYASKVRINALVEREEKLRKELANTLSLLRNEGAIEGSKSNELAMRFDRVFTRREDLGKFDILNEMVEGSIFVLTEADRRRLQNISDRIRIRLDEGTLEGEDVQKLDEILTRVEER